jgi:hypothetical protein
LSTTPPAPPSPAIPLTADLRAAYEDLYAKLENEIENSTDPGSLEVLNAAQANVDDILDKDDMYRLHADTALFQALLEQINTTNADLKTLRDQISAVASHFATAGDILAAINKVLTLIPGA